MYPLCNKEKRPPYEHFETFNAKSCILRKSERVLMFENK
jgi:hypothetical protein